VVVDPAISFEQLFAELERFGLARNRVF